MNAMSNMFFHRKPEEGVKKAQKFPDQPEALKHRR